MQEKDEEQKTVTTPEAVRNLSENQRAEYRKLKEAIQRREDTSKTKSASKSDSDVSSLDKGPFRPSVNSTVPQLCDEASDVVVIENNEVAQKWIATPFWSDSCCFQWEQYP